MYLVKLILVYFLVFISGALLKAQWQSDLIQIKDDGSLIYNKDVDDFILPDFSFAGYKYGEEALPEFPVVLEISPIFGDNTAHVQSAIDQIQAMEPNSKGIRGALLLTAGIYEISGSLYLSKSGVVLRGVGNAEDPETNTIIWARGDSPHQRTVIQLGNTSTYTWNDNTSNAKQYLLNDTVPIGSHSITIADASEYGIGDAIVIYHPCTEAWLQKVNYGDTGIDPNWAVNELPILFYRKIEAIEGNTITLDAPVFYPLIKEISASFIYKPSSELMKSNIGIENLRVSIESAGGEDENHAWDAIRFNLVENAWAKNCTAIGFGQAGFVTQYSYKVSINSCYAIDPVAILDGERMYNFNFYHGSQLILVKDCYARNGRHHYVSNGTSTVSGCVVYNCTSDASNAAIEGHRKWTTGLLFDNLEEINLLGSGRLVFALYNRGDKGTAHGWSAAHCVAWNCNFGDARACIQKPPGAQNYAIACFAKRINGDEVDFPQELGYLEGLNRPNIEPASLYIAQLNDRLGIQNSVASIILDDELSIYPNPSKGLFMIKSLRQNSIKQIQAFSMSGILVFDKKFETTISQVKIDTCLDAGIYLLQIFTDAANYTKQVVINE